jgi:hypothetical protein
MEISFKLIIQGVELFPHLPPLLKGISKAISGDNSQVILLVA